MSKSPSEHDSGPPQKPRSRDRKPKGMTVADYGVGKGKPPSDTRWKPGCPSPNPKGRPPKPKPGARDLDYFLDQKVEVPGPNGPEVYTKRELGHLQIANQHAKGAPWAIKLVGASQKAGSAAAEPMLFDEDLTRAIVAEAMRDLRAAKRRQKDKASRRKGSK